MKIDTSELNGNSPVFIIAELSANHGHDINVAIEAIKAVKH